VLEPEFSNPVYQKACHKRTLKCWAEEMQQLLSWFSPSHFPQPFLLTVARRCFLICEFYPVMSKLKYLSWLPTACGINPSLFVLEPKASWSALPPFRLPSPCSLSPVWEHLTLLETWTHCQVQSSRNTFRNQAGYSASGSKTHCRKSKKESPEPELQADPAGDSWV
jgi:hypothetical protein